MNRSKILVLLLVVLACSFTYAGSENINIPTEEQVYKLAAAVWKEPINSIHVSFYKDYTKVPESIEQLRKEAEEIADKEFKGRSIDELTSYEIERRDNFIEINLKNWVENQKFPRKTKSQLWISGDNYRIDMVEVGPNEPLGPNIPFVYTLRLHQRCNHGRVCQISLCG